MENNNEKSVGYIISNRVRRYGGAPAARDATDALTYSQLYVEATQLGSQITEQQPGQGQCIAVAGPANVRTLVTLLAIVLSGNYYVYADLSQPRAWLTAQLARLNCRRMIYSGDNPPDALPEGLTLLPAKARRHAVAGELPAFAPTQAAYVNFSSGSTGEPKAIACTHAGIVRLCQQQTFLDFDARPVFLFHSPLSFDAATLEIWGALLSGGCCVIHQEKMLTPQSLRQAIDLHGVNTLWLTASLFNALVDADVSCLRGLRTVLTGGDTLSVPHVRKALTAHPTVRFVNGYGPTENTTFTCCHVIQQEDVQGDDIPIGRAIAGTQVKLVDSQGEPVTMPGISGEIYALGEGLALGYLGDVARTAQAFVTLDGTRAYRTGDLACYDAQGNLRFLGRADSQVKINGYRINLNEIENRLRAVPGVEDCTLLVQQHQGAKRLIAALQADDDRPAREAAEHFPSWERPSGWFCVRALPLTRHGKVDRRALLAQWQAHQAQAPDPAMTRQEAACARWWSQLLGYPVTTRDQHFFTSGGNSLHALRLLAACHQHYADVPFSLHDLHQHATLAAFAALLTRKGMDAGAFLNPTPEGVLVL